MSRPLLVVFLGFPGSGKTYFSRQLAKKIHAVTLSSDALRLSMFGSIESVDAAFRRRDNARLYGDVFGAMDYASRQVLSAGYSVIYDAQQTKRENRRGIEKIAAESDAIPVLVWMKTSRETALKRGQEREAKEDSHQYDADKMEFLIDRFNTVTDLPEPDENVIEISGEVPFEEQFHIFSQGVKSLRGE